jgi:hypothetical protein
VTKDSRDEIRALWKVAIKGAYANSGPLSDLAHWSVDPGGGKDCQSWARDASVSWQQSGPLEAKGVTVEDRFEGPVCKQASFCDPDGNRVTIHESTRPR